MDAAQTQTQPLADRPTNTHLSTTTSTDKMVDLKGSTNGSGSGSENGSASDFQSMEYHRQILQGKLESGEK